MNPQKNLVLEKLAAARMLQPGVNGPVLRRGPPAASHEHLAMIHTYQRRGGLVTCDQAAMLLGRHRDQPISQLARWIVAREVVSFVWQSETLVPLFQFELADMTLRRGASEVVAELAGAFDDLELAAWLTRPNCWLGDAAPVAVLDTDQPAVLQAARADRYLARG
ncbi:MAG: hypothetical protein JWQ76_2602 [Ramlibacter sp.]|nr:hypothetical protein [Ramlibacter sp.]